LSVLFKIKKEEFVSNPKILIQASDFLTKMNIPYTSVKMFGKILVINTTDIESAKVIESVLNGSGIESVSIHRPDDRYDEEYSVVAELEEDL
jgi:hypothetical protein